MGAQTHGIPVACSRAAVVNSEIQIDPKLHVCLGVWISASKPMLLASPYLLDMGAYVYDFSMWSEGTLD